MNPELEQFKEWLRIKDHSERTVEVYSSHVQMYFDEGESLERYLRNILPLKTSTRNVYKCAIKSFFKFRGELAQIDPELLQTKTPTNQKRTRIPTDELNKYLNAAQPHHRRYDYREWRNYVILALFAYTGVRVQELMNITIADINMGHSIWIKGIKREEGGYVYPPEQVFSAIQNMINQGEYETENDRLIKLKYGTIWTLVKGLTNGKYSPKDFRTTFATEVAMQTRDPYLLKVLMRHKKISSGETYVQLAREFGEQIKEVKLYAKEPV